VKNSIEKLRQDALVKLGFDCIDAVILRHVIDMVDSEKTSREYFDGREYLWIEYQAIIDALPVCNMGSRDSVARRFRKYVKSGIMQHHTKRDGGTFSFFRMTELSSHLIFSDSDRGGYHA
jgi:hypothetical protein